MTGEVFAQHWIVPPGQQVLAVAVAFTLAAALKAWLWLRSRPRRRHLRAARRNGSMLTRPLRRW